MCTRLYVLALLLTALAIRLRNKPTYDKLRVLIFNKDVRKLLARKNGNENPIWSWNDSGTVWMSKLEITETYHWGTLYLSQVVTLTYIILSVTAGKGTLIFTNLILPMVWMEFTKYVHNLSETLVDMITALVGTPLPIILYGEIENIPNTCACMPHRSESFNSISCFMDDMIISVQGGTKH